MKLKIFWDYIPRRINVKFETFISWSVAWLSKLGGCLRNMFHLFIPVTEDSQVDEYVPSWVETINLVSGIFRDPQ